MQRREGENKNQMRIGKYPTRQRRRKENGRQQSSACRLDNTGEKATEGEDRRGAERGV